MTLGLVERLKNSDFILETEIRKLNKNKTSKQPDRPNVVWKRLPWKSINSAFIITI